MRLRVNYILPRSLALIVAITLVFITTLGNCDPMEQQQQPDYSPFTVEAALANNALTNTTTVSSSNSFMKRIPPWGRLELDRSHICQKYFLVFFDQWIVQVPPEWWEQKYDHDVEDACAAFESTIKEHLTWIHFLVTWDECWRMDKKYYSGDIGWLHMRFKTPILVQSGPVEQAIEQLRDKEHYKEHDIRLQCLG